ncbi:MAG: ATP-dependent sacrificial sulfur transferase LarE, partial [Gemmatimonadales bacterium]
YGIGITRDRLRQVEDAEAFLRSLGVTGDLRVRHHGDRARVEVSLEQISALSQRWSAVEGFFRGLGFGAVELDPRGYRRGGLLAQLPVHAG